MPKMHSLHIGINKYEEPYYNSKVTKLDYCINDMQKMAAIAEDFGVNSANIKELPDGYATRPNIFKKVKESANDMREEGGIFIFSFSGHGMQSNEYSVRPDEKIDSALCFADGPFVDDDMMYNLFQYFSEKCLVICFFDCCHSATAIKKSNFPLKHSNEQIKDAKARLMTTEGLTEMGKDKFKNNDVVERHDNEPLAKFISFSACNDDYLAYESDKYKQGYFTQAVWEVFEEDKNSITYINFIHKITAKIDEKSKQSPSQWFSDNFGSDMLKKPIFSI